MEKFCLLQESDKVGNECSNGGIDENWRLPVGKRSLNDEANCDNTLMQRKVVSPVDQEGVLAVKFRSQERRAMEFAKVKQSLTEFWMAIDLDKRKRAKVLCLWGKLTS